MLFAFGQLQANIERVRSGRLTDIDRAKGLAIFLVVLGHLVAGEPPADNYWFELLVTIIYAFHMPFFMYLSGFMMLYAFKPMQSSSAYVTYVVDKFKRLAPGFLLFALIILTGKVVAGQILIVDNQPPGFVQGLLDILLVPGQSSAKGLWFIYVLFEFYLVVPVLLFAFGGRPWVLVLLGAIVYFLPTTPLFMLEGVSEFLVYFAIGVTFAYHFETIKRSLDRFGLVYIAVFVASFSLLLTPLDYPTKKLIIGCLSIPALHALVRLRPFAHSQMLVKWGLVSYAIYLMNTIAIGLTKGVVLKFVSWDGTNFLWIAPILLLAGFYGPLLIKRHIFPRVPWLDRITS